LHRYRQLAIIALVNKRSQHNEGKCMKNTEIKIENEPEQKSSIAEHLLRRENELLEDSKQQLAEIISDLTSPKPGLHKLINKMSQLGAYKNEKRSFQLASTIGWDGSLNFPGSGQSNLRNLFTICQAILDGLENKNFGKMAPQMLFIFLAWGLGNICERYMNFFINIIEVKIESTPPSRYRYKPIALKSQSLSYAHPYYDTNADILSLSHENKLQINFQNIISIINQQLGDIPYSLFVIHIIPSFLRVLCNLTSAKFRLNSTKLLIPPISAPILNIYNLLKQPFLQAETRILDEEMKTLFRGTEHLFSYQKPLMNIIHRYTDSQAICFFEGRNELISDHNFPEESKTTPKNVELAPRVPK
jgi:hypothetical protein